tara:strand:- start:3877 stop:5004 length:1128 start_codon:yes stop_codon:yes gene_type:complete
MSHTVTKALQNEVQALKQLARFSWLTSQQIGLLIWPHSTNANQMSNRTLKRLLDKELIMSEPLNAKHFSARYRAYYLSPLGKMYLKAQFPDVKIYGFFGAGRKNDEGELYFLMSEKEHYHRFITNQFIIELELFDLFDIWVGDKEVFNENRLLAHKRRFKNMLGAVPDSFFVANEVGYVLETENVKRGPRKHGAKFYDFMSTFFEQIKLNDECEYRVSVHELPEVPGDEDHSLKVKTIFLCRDESIFRNIYRKVQNVIDETFSDEIEADGGLLMLDDCVYYLILNSKSAFQKTIIDDCELVDHQFAAHRVEAGTRKYKYSDKRMIEILEEYRDSDITMRELCEKNNIHSANVYRWNKRFNVFEASADKAKGWGIK